MFLVEKCFVVTVVLLSVVNVKAQRKDVQYCKDTFFHYSTPALICYNYEILPTNLINATEIKELRLQNQNLTILKNGELGATNLVNLLALDLEFNEIKKIELGAFRGGSKMKYLSLGWNQIEEIDLRVFKDLPNLEQLRLRENPLKFSSDAEFPNLNLKFLSLQTCKIHSIPPNLFRNLEQLKWLNLGSNQLKLLEWKAFLPLKSLEAVHLASNPFDCDCQAKFLLDFLESKNVTWVQDFTISCENSSTPFNKKLITVEWNEIDPSRQQLVCPPVINSIHVSKPSHDQTLNGNKMISVDCEYEGYPEPKVTWTKDEKPLSFGSGVTIQTQRVDDTIPEFNFKFKQTLTIPRSLAFFGSYKCHIFPNLVATLNIDASNLPGHSVLSTNFVLGLIVGLLLGVIITFGIYVAVRYSKVKQRQLPKKVYSIIPREAMPNSVPQTEGNVEEPPFPPSLGRARERSQNL